MILDIQILPDHEAQTPHNERGGGRKPSDYWPEILGEFNDRVRKLPLEKQPKTKAHVIELIKDIFIDHKLNEPKEQTIRENFWRLQGRAYWNKFRD